MKDGLQPPEEVIDVDFVALSRASAALRNLSAELGRNGTLADQLVDSPIGASLRRVEHDWHVRRSRLKRFLDETTDRLDQALLAYRDTDDSVRHAATPR